MFNLPKTSRKDESDYSILKGDRSRINTRIVKRCEVTMRHVQREVVSTYRVPEGLDATRHIRDTPLQFSNRSIRNSRPTMIRLRFATSGRPNHDRLFVLLEKPVSSARLRSKSAFDITLFDSLRKTLVNNTLP